MSTSLFIPLAEAVKTALNEHEFSRAFVAARIYDPLRALETLETMRVDVILGDRKQTPLGRATMQNTVRVEIAVRQVLKPPAGSDEEQAALDDLVGFVEEIDNWISHTDQRRLPAAPWAGWQGSELLYPFLPKHLRESRQFTSLLRLTYFVGTNQA